MMKGSHGREARNSWVPTLMEESVIRWERATPMALMGCVVGKKSAIGVARSQQ